MKNFIKKIIYKFENYKLTFNNFIITLLSIGFIRSFFEGLMERKRVIGHITTDNYYDSLRHNFNFWSLEWLGMFASLVLIFYIFTKENIIKISKILLIFYPVIILPVILDYFIYFPSGSDITYFYTLKEFKNALINFFVFNIEIPKASLGVRIEVLIAVIISFVYIYFKKNNLFIAFSGALIIYFISIASMAFPVFILTPALFFIRNADNFVFNFFSNASFPFDSESKVSIFIIFYLLFILFLLFIIYRKNLVKNFLLLIIKKHIIFFNISVFLFGLFLATKQQFLETQINVFNSNFTIFYIIAGILLCFFLFLLFLFLSPENSDIKKIFKKDFYTFSLILFLISIFLSISISYASFLTITFIFVLFYILFKNPFILYRFFILRVLLYSILSCVFFLNGFAFIYGIYAPQKIAFSLIAILFLLFFSIYFLINSNNKLLETISLYLIGISYLLAGIIMIDKLILFLIAIVSGILTLLFIFMKKKMINYYIMILFLFSFIIFI